MVSGYFLLHLTYSFRTTQRITLTQTTILTFKQLGTEKRGCKDVVVNYITVLVVIRIISNQHLSKN